MPLFLFGLGLCVFACLVEAWYERDWPRDTGKYLALLLALGIALS